MPDNLPAFETKLKLKLNIFHANLAHWWWALRKAAVQQVGKKQLIDGVP